MASSASTFWQIEGGKVEIVADFIFGGSKITGDDECSMKVMLSSWKESYDKPGQCIKKQRHHFADKGPYSQSDGFSSSHVRMWELDHKEGWALKNWCFQTVVLEKTLSIPWTSRRSNHSILKEINSEYSLEGLMLKLKLQYFGHLMWRAHSLEKILMLGSTEVRKKGGNRGWDGWIALPTQWNEFE